LAPLLVVASCTSLQPYRTECQNPLPLSGTPADIANQGFRLKEGTDAQAFVTRISRKYDITPSISGRIKESDAVVVYAKMSKAVLMQMRCEPEVGEILLDEPITTGRVPIGSH